MFDELTELDERPTLFGAYTARELWDDEHISKRMLAMHLDPEVDPASRKASFVEVSIEWIADRFDIGPGFRVADFGCGPGLYTEAFAKRGAEVTGIDFSRRSIGHATAQAERAGLQVNYVLGNYLDFNCDRRFDLITLIYCDYCPLSPAQRERLLRVIHRHLADGGSVLLDVFSLRSFEARPEAATFGRRLMDGFWAEGDYMGFMRTFRYESEKVILDKYTIVEPNRRRVIYNWLQYFSLASITGELEDNGLVVEAHYADVAGRPYMATAPEIAIVARKR